MDHIDGSIPGQSAVSPQHSYRKLSVTNRTNSLTWVFVTLPSQDGANTNASGLKICSALDMLEHATC